MAEIDSYYKQLQILWITFYVLITYYLFITFYVCNPVFELDFEIYRGNEQEVGHFGPKIEAEKD